MHMNANGRTILRYACAATAAVFSYVAAFYACVTDDGPESLVAIATIPALVAAAGWVIAFAGLKLKGIQRHDPWACERCGYDLRHNASGVCPECGTHL